MLRSLTATLAFSLTSILGLVAVADATGALNTTIDDATASITQILQQREGEHAALNEMTDLIEQQLGTNTNAADNTDEQMSADQLSALIEQLQGAVGEAETK